MAIVWEEKYSIGIEAIDEQHKKFIAILNRLSEAFLVDNKKEACAEILRELAEYAEGHFAFEEKYFGEFAFEAAAEHIAHHDEYRRKVRVLTEKLGSDDAGLEYELFDFVESWLVEHIEKEDKQYAALFLENGMK